jgi:hypothetical protein
MNADKFQWVFSEPWLNAYGKAVKLCRRQPGLTPFYHPRRPFPHGHRQWVV